MDSVVELVTDLRAPVLYALILAVVFAETAVLLGMFLPGETAAIVAGVLAAQHQIALQVVVPLVTVAAIAGDTTGYLLGRRFGPAVLDGRLLRRRRAQIERATATLRRHGALVIVGSRFLPFLRTVTPGAAGASGVPALTFVPAAFVGGLFWGVGSTLLGYVAADSYHRVEEVIGNTGLIVLALLLVSWWAVRRRRRRRAPDEENPDPESPAPARARPVVPVVSTLRRVLTVGHLGQSGQPGTTLGVVRPRRRTDRRRP
ncbi:DedA family protein [Cryptosporangium sp. NPDC048952]|uniref:DedA family protein n=1 Tax=Cryptosporangium sp. NPDC048952 TaxID=3363961 RepID=UPI0037110C37